MNLVNLYRLAESESIPVYCFELPLTRSMSVCNNELCAIAIDPFALESTAQEKVLLGHELGHCVTGSFYNRYSDYDVKAKAEYKADKWAVKKLIPKDELKSAADSGITEVWELAEYFNVTEDFVKKAIYIYGCMQ